MSEKTLDELADMLSPTLPPKEEEGDDDPSEVEEIEPDSPSKGNDEPDPEDTGDEEDEEDDDAGDDEEQPEEDDEGDDEDQPDKEAHLDVTDEDLIEVMIDGEVTYKTVGEAKKALSGEGAIEKRLQDATELRKTAKKEADDALKDLNRQRESLLGAYQQLQDLVFAPAVREPDPRLKETDPQRYIIQRDEYQQDQMRIQQGKAFMQQKVNEHSHMMQQSDQERRKQENTALAQAIPALTDPNTAPKAIERIRSVAARYGVSGEELASIHDHRLYKMAYEFGEFLEMKDSIKGKKQQKKEPAPKAPRRLRSGVAQKKSQAVRKQKEREKLRAAAAKSGRPDDVAKLL